MAREWQAICKDCENENKFVYSDTSYQIDRAGGRSRPERCPKHRALHSREIRTLGMSHYELRPTRPIDPAQGLQPGFLGMLSHPPRVHDLEDRPQEFDFDRFGITDDDMRRLFSIMRRHQVTVVVGPTGSGKSTFMPYRLMVPPPGEAPDTFVRYGQIIVTQPRIAAATAIPSFVAKDLHNSSGLGPGYDVGFRYSREHATDWRNKLVYITDGTLINWIVTDQIGRFSVIMIDEAHERSLNIDLILGLLKAQLPRYPHLRLVIASATIDADRFVGYYGGAEHVGHVEFKSKEPRWLSELKERPPIDEYGGPYYEVRFRQSKPISIHLWPSQMPALVAEKVFEILQAMECGTETEGDILGFLHGERPIEEACKRIRELVEENDRLVGKVDVFPLYTKLPQNQQLAAYGEKKDRSRRRVVISTNVAETSLTVEGIVHVVDSGLINEPNWDPATQTTIVAPTVHSRAGCRQRWGRSGRVRHGIVHCLYTEEQFHEFPPYTLPEIRRAPLEQTVLTAKVAGIDDVLNFDWIEQPSIEELERSSRALTQRGALDGEGYLTEHGLELRGFMDTPDIANLMVLADRFACAVEMATLLAMMKSGGRRALLRWNRDWDATTKRAVNRIHQGLIRPCQDDVEFYLKLYEAWAGDPDDENHKPDEWARANCVSHRVLKDKVKLERDKLLQPLTGHKKYDERRRINFDLLTRLRMVLVYGLPDRVYLLADTPQPATALDLDKPLYRPFVADHEGEGQSKAPSSDVWVEISPDSVCQGKTVEAFACLQKRSARRRLSPQAEPVTVIYASVLTLIKPEWLSCVGKSTFALARMMAKETRDEQGELRLTADRARLFLDQAYPVGSVFACQRLDGTGDSGDVRVLLERPLAIAPPVVEVSRDEEVDETLDVEQEEAETGPAEEMEVEDDELATLVVEDEEVELSWADLVEELMEEEESEERSGPQPVELTDEAGRTVQATGRLRLNGRQGVPNRPFAVEVEGFDFSDLQHPTVEVRLPHTTDPFQLFTGKYQEGAEVDVTVRTVEKYPNDYLTYLLVEHAETGLEIMMEPGDVSLIGRNFAVERLKPGDTFRAVVERIDRERQRVRITRLKYAEEDFLRFMGQQRERVVDGLIGEVRYNGLYVLLEPEDTGQAVPLGAFAGVQYLPSRPELSMLGKSCRVKVHFNAKRTWRRQLPLLPNGLIELLNRKTWGNHITANPETHVLKVVGRMTCHERITLLAQSADTGYRRAINWIYRRSNGLLADILDVEALEALAKAQQRNERQTGEIVRITDYGVFVELESGVQGLVRIGEIGWEPGAKNRIQEGQPVEVLVKEVNLDRARVELTMKRPETDPLHKYDVGMVVTGTLTGVQNYGAFVELEPGVKGLLHNNEISWNGSGTRAKDKLHLGAQILARVIHMDRQERKIGLSLRRAHEGTTAVPSDRIGVVIGPGGRTIQDLQKRYNARIEVEKNGSITIQAAEQSHIQAVCQEIQDLVYTYRDTIPIPQEKIGQLIGKGGVRIKRLMRETGARIEVDGNGLVTIESRDLWEVDAAKIKILEIVPTHKAMLIIPGDKIGKLIGRGGSTIKQLQQTTGADISVKEKTRIKKGLLFTSKETVGEVTIWGTSKAKINAAISAIQRLIPEAL